MLKAQGYSQTEIAEIGETYQPFISDIQKRVNEGTEADLYEDLIVAHGLERGACIFIDKDGVTAIDLRRKNASMYKMIKSMILYCNLKNLEDKIRMENVQEMRILEAAISEFHSITGAHGIYNRLHKEHEEKYKGRIIKGL